MGKSDSHERNDSFGYIQVIIRFLIFLTLIWLIAQSQAATIVRPIDDHFIKRNLVTFSPEIRPLENRLPCQGILQHHNRLLTSPECATAIADTMMIQQQNVSLVDYKQNSIGAVSQLQTYPAEESSGLLSIIYFADDYDMNAGKLKSSNGGFITKKMSVFYLKHHETNSTIEAEQVDFSKPASYEHLPLGAPLLDEDNKSISCVISVSGCQPFLRSKRQMTDGGGLDLECPFFLDTFTFSCNKNSIINCTEYFFSGTCTRSNNETDETCNFEIERSRDNHMLVENVNCPNTTNDIPCSATHVTLYNFLANTVFNTPEQCIGLESESFFDLSRLPSRLLALVTTTPIVAAIIGGIAGCVGGYCLKKLKN